MNPDEMDYEPAIDNDFEDDDDEDDDLEDVDYIVELEATTDAGEDDDDEDDEDDEDNEDGGGEEEEEEGLSEEEGRHGNVRFRLVHEDEDIDDGDDGAPIRHFLTIPGGMPFRVEILGFSRGGRDPRRDLVKGAEPVPSPEGQRLMKDGQFGSVGIPSSITMYHQSYVNQSVLSVLCRRSGKATQADQTLESENTPTASASSSVKSAHIEASEHE